MFSDEYAYRFESNTYVVADEGASHFTFVNQGWTVVDWQAGFGQDPEGRVAEGPSDTVIASR